MRIDRESIERMRQDDDRVECSISRVLNKYSVRLSSH